MAINKLRFFAATVFRQIYRDPVRTVITVGVAALFILALGVLQQTIENAEAEIDRLYLSSTVNSEILIDPRNHALSERALGDIIPGRVVNNIINMGVIADMYRESGYAFALISSTPKNQANNFDRLFAVDSLDFLTEDIDRFIGRHETDIFAVHEHLGINFAAGFGKDSFVYNDETLSAPIPIVIPESMAQRNSTLGGSAYINFLDPTNFDTWYHIPAKVIGVHDGAGLEYNIHNAAILPVSALEFMLEEYIGYITFRFTINPEYNRDLEFTTRRLEMALLPHPTWTIGGEGWRDRLILSLMDNELRLVVHAMERNIYLMELLYPLAIVLGILIGIGVALIIALQNTAIVAICRSLGFGKLRSSALILAEQTVLCLLGAIIGIVALAIISQDSDIRMFAAFPYLGGAILGTVVGIFIIINRPVLALLQAKQ